MAEFAYEDLLPVGADQDDQAAGNLRRDLRRELAQVAPVPLVDLGRGSQHLQLGARAFEFGIGGLQEGLRQRAQPVSPGEHHLGFGLREAVRADHAPGHPAGLGMVRLGRGNALRGHARDGEQRPQTDDHAEADSAHAGEYPTHAPCSTSLADRLLPWPCAIPGHGARAGRTAEGPGQGRRLR